MPNKAQRMLSRSVAVLNGSTERTVIRNEGTLLEVARHLDEVNAYVRSLEQRIVALEGGEPPGAGAHPVSDLFEQAGMHLQVVPQRAGLGYAIIFRRRS
jgi:hypothetical protein